VAHDAIDSLYSFRPIMLFGNDWRYTFYQQDPIIDDLPAGTAYAFSEYGGGGASTFLDLTDTPSSYSGQGGKKVKVKADESGLEFVTDSGGGAGAGRVELIGFPVIPFDQDYYYAHEMAGAVEISVNTTLVRAFPNNTILYIKANGTNKPTFKTSDNFSILFDGWNNTAGEWNRLRLEWSPQGNPVVQIMDTSGASNPGTGATVIMLTFDEDDSFSHVITGTVSLAVNVSGAVVTKRTIGYFLADGTNKPMWSSPIECNFDNYVNTAGVWNRFYLEWTPENKVTLQIQNT
jgi:hypothetical protein